jgi:hypothetical protein
MNDLGLLPGLFLRGRSVTLPAVSSSPSCSDVSRGRDVWFDWIGMNSPREITEAFLDGRQKLTSADHKGADLCLA